MKVIAINGSPRKKWNTGTLLEKALEGAASAGADTELIHLYDLDFKGCTSCFACKTRNGENYGRCAMKDDLTPVYAGIRNVDALFLGSPVYFGDVTGEMRSFIERLLFPYLVYSSPPESLFPKRINIGFIYTMNVPEEFIPHTGLDRLFYNNEQALNMVLGKAESLMSYDTYQFEDYSRVVAEGINEQKKLKRREEIFPVDCSRAFDLGTRIAKGYL